MKKITKHTLIFVLFASFLASCTKDFEELNTDKTKISTIDNASLDFVFSAAQYRGAFGPRGPFQLFEALYADLQCQYFATTQKAFGSDRNQMVGNWLNGAWNHFYGSANPQMDVVLEYTKAGGKLEDPIKNAIAKIWKVYMFMPVTDCWGAVPYSQAGNGKNEVLYDSQEDIYNDFFKSLKEATTVLNAYTGTTKFFEKGDLIYGGDVKKWLKFGNTLRLRAAMRISLKNPTLAKAEAEAAVTAGGGLLTSNADNAYMTMTPTTPNPLGSISAWGEFRMSAAMESVLKGYNDPRMQKFFDPALTGGAYKGIRNGMSIAQMSLPANGNNANCNINSAFGFDNSIKAPWTVFTASETCFLLAEGKLNGWDMGSGTTQSYYNDGIAASLDQWGIKDATIVNNYKTGTTTPIALGDTYSTPALTNIPVLFSATAAIQREQIGTQKWLALYPYSPEAWSEYKRTGFPKLYPRLNSDNLDSPATDPASVRRLTYPPIEASVNAGGLASGVTKLGGPDKSSTKVWWNQ
jgi:hypothetical protein